MPKTREEVARLLALGRTPAEVADALGVARNTVYYHRDRLREQADADGVVAPLPPKARHSVETRRHVAELLADGLPHARIAARLDVSLSTVAYHARRLGVPVDERAARRYDWRAVQAYYDAGHSVRECIAAFGFSSQSWHAAKQRGDLVTRGRGLELEVLLGEGRRSRGNVKRRLLEAGVKERRCERCGRSEWLGGPIPLDLHHANGTRDDNRLENLRLLCPNCHVLADREVRRRHAA